jgi:hypothetical protein
MMTKEEKNGCGLFLWFVVYLLIGVNAVGWFLTIALLAIFLWVMDTNEQASKNAKRLKRIEQHLGIKEDV